MHVPFSWVFSAKKEKPRLTLDVDGSCISCVVYKKFDG